MLAFNVLLSVWLTECFWFYCMFGGMLLAPLWRRLSLDGDDLE